jgi:arginyl-tRNA synthetase
VKHCTDKHLKATRLAFINAFAAVLKKGLFLLGIRTVERM